MLKPSKRLETTLKNGSYNKLDFSLKVYKRQVHVFRKLAEIRESRVSQDLEIFKEHVRTLFRRESWAFPVRGSPDGFSSKLA
jgi:hypothetical protein